MLILPAFFDLCIKSVFICNGYVIKKVLKKSIDMSKKQA